MSQSDFPSIEPTLSQNHHRHVPSILKKPSPHFTTKPSFIAESREIFQESRKKSFTCLLSSILLSSSREEEYPRQPISNLLHAQSITLAEKSQ